VAAPFTIVQLTDPHIGAPWSEHALEALIATVASVRSTLGGHEPGVAVVTGDIANTPTDTEYEQARSALEPLGALVYVLPGNHDERDGLRRHFDLPASAGEFINYVADLGPVRLIALDTKRDGSAGGELDGPRLAWLERALGEDRTTPTLLAMHHPPLVTGLPAMDSIAIPLPEREALAELVAEHDQLQLIVAGHVHRAIVGALAGTPVVAIPSTGVQLKFDFDEPEVQFAAEPPCFALHALVDGRLVTHIQPVLSEGDTPPGTS
jgi:3',5'-cyclic AMP phosphodiesterase CpdA